jgi:hypothetical protein
MRPASHICAYGPCPTWSLVTYGVRFVVGRVLFMFPVRLFVFIRELDIEFPTDDELLIELEYEFEFDIVLLDIVDEPPYEFEPLIELLFI